LPARPYAFGVGFKDRLSQARKAKGLSQETLGEAVDGMSKQGISHWETGRYEPNIDQLERLCEVLECSADWLILGRSQEGLPPDAIEQARFFDKLPAEQKKKWRAMRMMFVEPLSDEALVRRSPGFKKPKRKEAEDEAVDSRNSDATGKLRQP
jgi:transcriptional regulator with XRE-family HTH domain